MSYMCTNVGSVYTTVLEQWNIYVQCGSVNKCITYKAYQAEKNEMLTFKILR